MSTTVTPEYAAEIDTKIAELQQAKDRTGRELGQVAERIYTAAGATPTRDARTGRITGWSLSFTDAGDALPIDHPLLAKYEALSETFENQADGLAELRACYTGWSRFYVVDNSNGGRPGRR